MDKGFSTFVFRTRGLYMLAALGTAIFLKQQCNQTTHLVYLLIGITIAVIAQAFRVWAAAYLWGREAVPEVEANFLCISGPYAYIRNPFYLGNLVIGIALCVMINEWYAYVLFLISYAFVYSVVIPHEEKFLEEKFGENYVTYKHHTGRLIPNFRLYKLGDETIPDWRAGILGEIHVTLFVAIFPVIIYLLFVL